MLIYGAIAYIPTKMNILCYLSFFLLLKNTVNYAAGIRKDFGGMEHGDDQSAMLKAGNKQLTQIVQDTSFREFEFRQFLFARQAKVIQLDKDT